MAELLRYLDLESDLRVLSRALEWVAQDADPGDLDLDHVARLEIGRGAVGPHPDDIAGIEREIAAHRTEISRDAEQHSVGGKAQRLLTVDAHDGLEVVELEHGITKVILSGRLDIEGALKIDNNFNDLAEKKKKVLVDLSGVTFIASLGIRTLITGAKATANNGGKMVLLNPQPNVEGVLRTSRVDTVIPITHDSTTIEAVFGA